MRGSSRWLPPTPAWRKCSAPKPSSCTACAVADTEAPAPDDLADGRPPGPAETPRWSPLPLGVGAIGLLLAALLAPTQPLSLPIEARWVAAYLLFVLVPGWLLV